METRVVAQLIQGLYSAGRITSDEKLDERDIEQLVILARGEAIRIQLEKSIRLYGLEGAIGGGYLSHYATVESKEVKHDSYHYIEVGDVMSLRNGYGILNIIGKSGGDACVGSIDFSRIRIGTGWQVNCNELEENEVPFEPLGDKIKLYNVPDCLDKVDVLAIKKDGMDSDVPDEIAYTILRMCFDIAKQTKMFFVDSLDDYSATNDQQRNLLAQFQANDERASKSI